MSLLELDKLSPDNLIVQYVVECRGQGHFLRYEDYGLISNWLKIAGDPDVLLLVLADILPGYFDASRRSGPARNLGGVNRRVLKQLNEQRLMGVNNNQVR